MTVQEMMFLSIIFLSLLLTGEASVKPLPTCFSALLGIRY
jgi:hypothetical protein